ncbi:hypothetical protein RRG08_007879 [Elysia crispata]|uniref:C-type lectin domain-containing protein n=1 Tax=Elysia crispata TaxID=231223 RepID=A0AAE0XW54_9GAST|nr:hypothetical protein RRG08_007879 [Elysia crispata]
MTDTLSILYVGREKAFRLIMCSPDKDLAVWNVKDCGRPFRFICYVPVLVCPPGGVVLMSSGICIKFQNEVVETEADADAICRASGGSLKIALNATTHQLTFASHQAINPQYWTEFNEIINLRETFHPQFQVDEIDDCVLTNFGGSFGWKEEACNQNRSFICEYLPEESVSSENIFHFITVIYSPSKKDGDANADLPFNSMLPTITAIVLALAILGMIAAIL